MKLDKLFPNCLLAMRNSIAVGLISSAASLQNSYPPSLQTIYTFITAFLIAFLVEFGNTYRQKRVKGYKSKELKTFFLP